MTERFLIFVLLISLSSNTSLLCQTDEEPPVSPVLKLVTIDNGAGKIHMEWSPSPSVDVSGYIIYNYENGEGHSIDTIFNPNTTSYDNVAATGAGYFSQFFVIAAMDSSFNISPLSNELGTIHLSAIIDTCNRKIELHWSEYISYPKNVLGYRLMCSIDGDEWENVAETDSESPGHTIENYMINSEYRCKVIVNLEGGYQSESNITDINTDKLIPPEWINANQATTGIENQISLSFTIDPLSEIYTFSLERRESGNEYFEQIAILSSSSGHLDYVDNIADPTIRYNYRLVAINNCGIPVIYSNIASNIVLSYNRIDENIIDLKWNRYSEWIGSISEQILLIDTGNGYYEEVYIPVSDSTITIYYNDFIESIVSGEILFMVKIKESENPFGIFGESLSQPIRIRTTEKITVPNIFTPDDNGINDLFRPVLSFIPKEYNLIITELNGKTIFESSNYLEYWDGKSDNGHFPEGVYLWKLTIKTLTDETVKKTGTVTIAFNL